MQVPPFNTTVPAVTSIQTTISRFIWTVHSVTASLQLTRSRLHFPAVSTFLQGLSRNCQSWPAPRPNIAFLTVTPPKLLQFTLRHRASAKLFCSTVSECLDHSARRMSVQKNCVCRFSAHRLTRVVLTSRAISGDVISSKQWELYQSWEWRFVKQRYSYYFTYSLT